MNIGRKCNQACRHCHVNAGPDRKEMMNKATIDKCVEIITTNKEIEVVDITGGAPEMNEHFTYLVETSIKAGKKVIERCNLTILEEEGYGYLYDFLAENRVEIVASFPHYHPKTAENVRGQGVYDKSLRALKKLNQLGYGTKYGLNLVYNPNGFYLVSSQKMLEKQFKQKLLNEHGIHFTNLLCINNFPVNRFLESLVGRGKFEEYMDTLASSFNPATLDCLMCRNQISVSYDGYIYDCDFNQMLDIKAEPVMHINDFDYQKIINRKIKTNNHCYCCTAGAGTSCGGELA